MEREKFSAEEILKNLGELEFTSEYEQDDDGNFTVSVKEIEWPFGIGKTKPEARRDLIKNMRQWGEALRDEKAKWDKKQEKELSYLLKIYVSSDAELLSCLN